MEFALCYPAPRTITHLPPELLHQIFLHLPTRALRRAVLVCRLWREVGRAPGLWAWGVVRVNANNMAALPSLLARDRLRDVRELRVEHCHIVTVELLDAVVRHRGLRKVVFTGVGMSSVAPGQLARALEGLQQVDFVDTFLDGQQIEAVLGAISGQTRMDIRNTDLSSQVDNIRELFNRICEQIGFDRSRLGILLVGTKYQIFTGVMALLGVTGYIMLLGKYHATCEHIYTPDTKLFPIHTFKVENLFGCGL